ncbi:MAG: class I SAM-dependent methyltransferase [Candidatus Dojkabacteria bacterium]
MDLYSTHAKEFSKTRQSPWKGWKKLIKSEELIVKSELAVLDLGCGNGRFLKYLLDQDVKIERYVGVDNSKILLNIARAEFKELVSKSDLTTVRHGEQKSQINFETIDLNTMDWSKNIDGSFNLIVSFGLIHHIESFQLRRNLLESAAKLLEKGGILVVAYWQFLKDSKLKFKAKKIARENDYELPFGQNGAKRFCHFVNETEALKLEENLLITRIDSYYADGKSEDLNYYVVYRKN